jgi:hypothetical protein
MLTKSRGVLGSGREWKETAAARTYYIVPREDVSVQARNARRLKNRALTGLSPHPDLPHKKIRVFSLFDLLSLRNIILRLNRHRFRREKFVIFILVVQVTQEKATAKWILA